MMSAMSQHRHLQNCSVQRQSPNVKFNPKNINTQLNSEYTQYLGLDQLICPEVSDVNN